MPTKKPAIHHPYQTVFIPSDTKAPEYGNVPIDNVLHKGHVISFSVKTLGTLWNSVAYHASKINKCGKVAVVWKDTHKNLTPIGVATRRYDTQSAYNIPVQQLLEIVEERAQYNEHLILKLIERFFNDDWGYSNRTDFMKALFQAWARGAHETETEFAKILADWCVEYNVELHNMQQANSDLWSEEFDKETDRLSDGLKDVLYVAEEVAYKGKDPKTLRSALYLNGVTGRR